VLWLSVVLLATAMPAVAQSQKPANVRPFFGVGYSVPIEFQDFDRGFGMGLGFEIEQSAFLSGIFRIDWNEVFASTTPGNPYAYPSRRSRSGFTWSAGLRLYAPRASHLYSEATLGARMIGDESPTYYAMPAAGSGAQDTVDPNGLAATVRIGLSTASRGGSGFFLDGAYEFSIEHPDAYGMVPIRFGVIFP
jgi:hypothetical protein